MSMRTSPTINRDYELWILLDEAITAIGRGRQNELRQFGISRMQFAVLGMLETTEAPLTSAQISRWIFREPHTVSGLLKRMERSGLIRRVQDAERKHLTRIVITDKGNEIYHRATRATRIPEVMSCLSSKEKESLRAYLLTLRDRAIEQLAERPRLPFL